MRSSTLVPKRDVEPSKKKSEKTKHLLLPGSFTGGIVLFETERSLFDPVKDPSQEIFGEVTTVITNPSVIS